MQWEGKCHKGISHIIKNLEKSIIYLIILIIDSFQTKLVK